MFAKVEHLHVVLRASDKRLTTAVALKEETVVKKRNSGSLQLINKMGWTRCWHSALNRQGTWNRTHVVGRTRLSASVADIGSLSQKGIECTGIVHCSVCF